MNRRQFLSAAVACGATLARRPKSLRRAGVEVRPAHQGRPRHRPVRAPRCRARRGDLWRPHRRRRAEYRGRRRRNHRCARQARRPRPDRHPHPYRPVGRRARPGAARRRHRVDRRRVARRRRHSPTSWPSRDRRRSRGASSSTSDAAASCLVATRWILRGPMSPPPGMRSRSTATSSSA